MPDERLRDRLRVRAVPFHAQRQRLDSPRREPRIHRPGHRAGRELHESDPVGELLIVQDDGAAEHVRVPAEVLGGGVHDDVRPQREGVLQVRRGERVVHDDESAGLMADVGERRDVRNRHERVARRLDPQHRRGGGDCRAHRVEVAHVDDAQTDAPRYEDAVHEAVGAAVDIVAHEHVVPGGQNRAQERILRGEAGRETQGPRAALEARQLLLQRVPRRVRAPRVLVSVAQVADALLHERRREIHRRDDRARGGIEPLAVMDGAGAEVVGHGFTFASSGGYWGFSWRGSRGGRRG